MFIKTTFRRDISSGSDPQRSSHGSGFKSRLDPALVLLIPCVPRGHHPESHPVPALHLLPLPISSVPRPPLAALRGRSLRGEEEEEEDGQGHLAVSGPRFCTRSRLLRIQRQSVSAGRKISSCCPWGFVSTDSHSTEVFFLLCEFFQMKGNSLSAHEQNKQRSGESCCALKLCLPLFCCSNCC